MRQVRGRDVRPDEGVAREFIGSSVTVFRLSDPGSGERVSRGYWENRAQAGWGNPYHSAYLNDVTAMDERNLSVLNHLAAGRKLDVLEGACGYGRYAEKVSPFCKSYLGVDFCQPYIGEAILSYPEFRFQQGDLETLQLDEWFDLIFMVGPGSSIDANSAEVVTNLKGHLRPSGVLVWFEESGYTVLPA